MTEKSFNESFEEVFGHSNKFLKQRILNWFFGQLKKPRTNPLIFDLDPVAPITNFKQVKITFYEWLNRILPIIKGSQSIKIEKDRFE
jgi:hypothetical protein